MVDNKAKIKELEDELKKTPYNKRTQHHIGLTKAKIANLRQKEVSRARGKGKTSGYTVRKTGDATVVLIGFPSVGKSTLLNALTNADSKVAKYAFTTLTCIPGLLKYKSAKIQILDVPGIVSGAAAGTGRGKEVLAVVRNADLILMIVDVFDLKQLKVLEKELYDSNIRMNQEKPIVKIKPTVRGGVQIGTTVKLTKLNNETITGVMKEFKQNNAHVLIRDDISVDQLIDVIEKNKEYIPAITLLNKMDLVTKEELDEALYTVRGGMPISGEKNINLDCLRDEIFNKLQFVRIYLKEVGKKADLEEPLIMRKGCTVKDVCEKLHREFISKFRFAKVWGKSAKFPGQVFRLDHELKDKDIVQINLK
ncbi:MAG: GTP-binding protein [bacterium]|nr:GTP-binding protein [bacterium]